MNLKMFGTSPQPSVVHLVTLFRQIAAGDIRIPAFQREFVWSPRQIVELLDSVKVGYPIGSLLFWYVEQPILKIANSADTAFPDVPERYPTNYVLDGMQRLSSLYGVFHFDRSVKDGIFSVWYDLENKIFVHEGDVQAGRKDASVPLGAIFNPRQLLDHQSKISTLENGDALIESLLEIQAAFQDYMVPVVTIRGDDITRIVGIFEKINSTGTPLDTVDFMRAITWQQNFDLSSHLDETASWLQEMGFSLPDETVIKCVGLLLDIPPTAEDLLKLRGRDANELASAFQDLRNAFSLVIGFVRTRFCIQSAEYVPYEGQTLVLFKAIGMGELESPDDARLLERWFWATGFNESLRGKPDHYVVRAVAGWRDLIRGNIRGLEPRLKLSPVDFSERRFIKGKALSAAVAAMFAVRSARSLLSGEIIDQSQYMATADARSFGSLFSADELRTVGFNVGSSSRVLANIVIMEPHEAGRMGSGQELRAHILRMADDGRRDVLESQFIEEWMIQMLRDEDISGFIWSRAESMFEEAERFVAS